MNRQEIESEVEIARGRTEQSRLPAEIALLSVYADNQQLARDIWNLKQDKEHLLTRITALEKKLNKST